MNQTTEPRPESRVESLDGAWRLRSLELDAAAPLDHVDVAAEVPGAVHLDLVAAGLLTDPLHDDGELHQWWVGRSSWELSRPLPAQAPIGPDERVELVFHGLDTLATVLVDDHVVARTENMHRRYRVDITSLLRDNDATRLAVRFDAPVIEAERRRDEWGDLPNPYGTPYAFLRKSACNFGWDWGPTLTTAGIWRSAELHRWRTARLAVARPSVRVGDDGTGVIDLTVEVDRVSADDERPLVARATVGGTEQRLTITGATGSLRLEVPAVERWWPRGRGAQPLHDLRVELSVDDRVLDTKTRRIGFRDVAIDRRAQDDGERWAIVVNGERVWVRGLNWIPESCFPGELRRADHERVLGEAVAAGANLVRVWGGGLYEDDAFYDVCDELGLMVWQDFAFACAAYPEDQLRDEVEAEAADNVDRLAHHASLVLWNGNNEVQWGWHDWGWQDVLGDRRWGLGFYDEVLPAVVARLDPARPYVPSSPWSPPPRHPNDPDAGPMHIWDVWNDRDYVDYRTYRPRFVSELGFQAPATHATLAAAIDERPLHHDSPSMAHRQRADRGAAKLERSLTIHHGAVDDTDDWWFLTQVNQAHAVDVAMGHFRSLHDRCAGVIWWQLNDCWPSISWSLVDHAGRRKPAWYAFRRSAAPRAVTVAPVGAGVVVTAINDERDPWRAELVLHVHTPSGGWTSAATPLVVPGDSVHHVDVGAVLGMTIAPDAIVVADLDGRRHVHAPDGAPPEAQWDTAATPTARGWRVSVTAHTLVTDLCLFADRLDPAATVDTQLVDLLPGETHVFDVSLPAGLSIDPITAATRPVLRAGNDRPAPPRTIAR